MDLESVNIWMMNKILGLLPVLHKKKQFEKIWRQNLVTVQSSQSFPVFGGQFKDPTVFSVSHNPPRRDQKIGHHNNRILYKKLQHWGQGQWGTIGCVKILNLHSMCFLFVVASSTWRTKNYGLEMQTQVLKDFKGITNFTALFFTDWLGAFEVGWQHKGYSI